ncbi:hypothetical protein KBB12_02015 [Candidatus Woesebacteria bacterium]|nr:hypothetical protein [Candidatus Woesebacteria bacterium]
MQLKKILGVFIALTLLITVFTSYNTRRVEAGCKCVSTGTTNQEAGKWISFDDGQPSGLNGCDGPPSTGAPGTCGDTVAMPVAGCGPCNPLNQAKIGMWFRVPTLGDLVGNIIRLMFFIAGLYALVLLLLGGFEWVSSGGEEKKLTSARGKILNAIIGLVVMVAVLTLVILLEQVVFGGKVCLGISCPINMGDLRIIK